MHLTSGASKSLRVRTRRTIAWFVIAIGVVRGAVGWAEPTKVREDYFAFWPFAESSSL
jgi:hypothetical protein